MAIKAARDIVKTSIQYPGDLKPAIASAGMSYADLIEAGLQHEGYETRAQVLREARLWHLIAERTRVLRRARGELEELLEELPEGPLPPVAEDALRELRHATRHAPPAPPRQRHAPLPGARPGEPSQEEGPDEQSAEPAGPAPSTTFGAVTQARGLSALRAGKPDPRPPCPHPLTRRVGDHCTLCNQPVRGGRA